MGSTLSVQETEFFHQLSSISSAGVFKEAFQFPLNFLTNPKTFFLTLKFNQYIERLHTTRYLKGG